MQTRIDRKIIQELQKDGRKKYTDIAGMLGVSEGTIRNRVKVLLKQGTLKVTAVVNPQELGYTFISIIGMQVRINDLQRVGETLTQNPHVYYAAFVSGRYDILIIVMNRTPGELSDFIKYLSAIPSIVRTETFQNLEVIKSPWMEPGLSFYPQGNQE
ncbi:MAG: Lrp/AsnC family transcriptional regulator [Dehalococcoidia bacterium]|nr:Lrp/AsnC family transcriptional regulator [Dehalococcoidia bacterium]